MQREKINYHLHCACLDIGLYDNVYNSKHIALNTLEVRIRVEKLVDEVRYTLLQQTQF